MRHLQTALAALALLVALLSIEGCGGDTKVDTIQESPEAKKADEAGQKAMEEFMRTKGQSKSKARS